MIIANWTINRPIALNKSLVLFSSMLKILMLLVTCIILLWKINIFSVIRLQFANMHQEWQGKCKKYENKNKFAWKRCLNKWLTNHGMEREWRNEEYDQPQYSEEECLRSSHVHCIIQIEFYIINMFIIYCTMLIKLYSIQTFQQGNKNRIWRVTWLYFESRLEQHTIIKRINIQ